MSDYQKAIELLTSSTKFHIKLGLERTAEFLKLLDNPQEKFKIIHIAGTNGKGSTAAMLAEILKNSGFKTGLYTSPHIFEYTERIKINGAEISQQDFAKIILEVCELSEKHSFDLTEFETLTCAAFYYFANKKIDFLVLETGLGGRLDSTNVIKSNFCSVIASVSFDHTDKLGDTIEKIAFEKAGIIKENCPVVISKSNSGFDVIERIAKERNSELILADENIGIIFENRTNYAVINGKKYQFALMGKYQKENLGLVVPVVELLRKKGFGISEDAFALSLQNVKWSARFEYRKDKNILIDAAHNPGGAKVLRESLDYYFPDMKRIWIYGSLNTKNFKENMKILFRKEDEVHFYHFNYKNSALVEELILSSPYGGKGLAFDNIKNIVKNRRDDELLIISGSFYMLDEVLKEC